ENGTLGYRCPSEPEDDYAAKGGDLAATAGRLCLCNGLLAAVGLPQLHAGTGIEPPLLTLGDEVGKVLSALSPDARPYHARDVVDYIMAGQETAVAGAAAAPAAWR
ncbi:MAG: nitronate monooxygenase, partial [Actinomycetota bacterium]|nr:nitronate monooxygenase [Actinomycetota bacterium]